MKTSDITFVVPTSVLVTHPDTSIIDEVISSIRNYFPENEIILQIDGLRKEQQHRKEQYDEYKNRVLWKCLHEYKNVLPIVFKEHNHQSDMMKATIDLINTPLMFYIEGDISIKQDINVNWQDVVDLLASEKAFTVRFYTYNHVIEPSHMHLMLEQDGDFIQTFQWSQQPHVSYVSYYRNMVLPNTTPKLFIEDKFHGKVFADCHETPEEWDKHRLWLYNPLGKDIRIANNLDGRKHLRKFTSDDEAWGLTEA
jgi:hypothetical protein